MIHVDEGGLRCDSGPSSRSRRWYRFPLYGLVQDPHHGPALWRADRQGPAARHRRSRLRTDKLTDGDDAPVMVGGAPLDVADLVGETEALAIDPALAGSTSDGCSAHTGPYRISWWLPWTCSPSCSAICWVYHCFDRIVIHSYLSALSRPEQVVHFVRKIVGVPVVSKEILSQRTADYQNWVEAYARNHHTPIEWAEDVQKRFCKQGE